MSLPTSCSQSGNESRVRNFGNETIEVCYGYKNDGRRNDRRSQASATTQPDLSLPCRRARIPIVTEPLGGHNFQVRRTIAITPPGVASGFVSNDCS